MSDIAIIKTCEGEMMVELWPDVAPGHVENFKRLATQGFYDGTCFHRVIKGFMIQGGDPLTKDETNNNRWGTGGPGYFINAEFNNQPHVRGVLSMARANDPNSAGSQFFICHGDPRFLDRQYTAFGKLIKGDDVLERIATAPTQADDRPVKRINVQKIMIVGAESTERADAESFRMAVDDVFWIENRGVVVTGLINQGTVKVGDEVYLKGEGSIKNVRVGAIEQYRKLLTKAERGQNVGLLLQGLVSKSEVHPGDQLVSKTAGDEDASIISPLVVVIGLVEKTDWQTTFLNEQARNMDVVNYAKLLFCFLIASDNRVSEQEIGR